MEFDISQLVFTIVVVCLFLWRISYGTNNGLFAEATGLIAVIAAFAAVYYIMNIAGSVLGSNFGQILPKIGYLVVAFIVYNIMSALGKAFRRIKEIPILGGLDRLFGAVLGAIEAYMIIYIIEYVTDIRIFDAFLQSWNQVYEYISESLLQK